MSYWAEEKMKTNKSTDGPPLIAHLIYALGVGGLENGLVNLINHMPKNRYRHTIICLTDYTDFKQRITRDDVDVYALYMRKGKDFSVYMRLIRLLRQLKPTVIHTRNLSAIEGQVSAFIAGVPCRVHGEHGRDVFDLHGNSWKYNILRRLMRKIICQYTCVSKDLKQWLENVIHVSPQRITQIYNGVDIRCFTPRKGERSATGPTGFLTDNCIVIGTVGRMAEVKDQITLVRAFISLAEQLPEMQPRLRLVIIGEGVLRERAQSMLRDAGMENMAWLPGERNDIPEILRSLDIFVLPSLGEGISNTILEAMSTGLPVVATAVGGNAELVDENKTGYLVPPGNPDKMVAALKSYINYPDLITAHGHAGRKKVESDFSIENMVQGYMDVYDAVIRSCPV